MTLDPAETLAFYVVAVLVLMTVLAGIAELLEKRIERRVRDEARAAARAKRNEGVDPSLDALHFSPSERLPYGS